MAPEKGKLSSSTPPAGKCSSVAPGKGQAVESEPTPLSASAPPGGVLTYKRKKGDSNISQNNQESKRFKTGPFTALQDHEHDERQRVQTHSLEVIKSIVEPKYVNGICQDNFWLSVLKCCKDHHGLAPLLIERLGNKDGNENLQNGTSEAEEGYHSKTIPVGADNKLKEILSSRDSAIRSGEYKIPSDTVTGKLEGVLYDVLTSGKFGLLCDIICESFQTTKKGRPVKMDFIVGFSSILAKVREGSYNQSPELFEQDIQAILKKLTTVGREMAALAYGLAALTKYHCQELIDGVSFASAAEKSTTGERISEKASGCSGGISAPEKCDTRERISENTTEGSAGAASSDKCDPCGEIRENALGSSQVNDQQQIGSFGCALAEGKCDLGENNFDLELTNPLLRFLTRQLGDLGCFSTVDKCNVGENMVENASCLHLADEQIGCLAYNSAAEKSKVSEKNIDKAMGSSDENNRKSTNKCAAKVIDVNSCAATIINSCAANVGVPYKIAPKPKKRNRFRHSKTATCKHCGTDADGSKSLICDGCEAMYHIACTDFIQESPSRSWFCTQCRDKNDSEETDVSNDQHDCLHEASAVCERLKAPECPEDRFSTCKRCGTEAHGSKSLICDGCEAMYHIACIEPVIQESPLRSWFCTECSDKNESEEINVSNDQHGCLHEACVVCERLKASECPEDRHRNMENFATIDVHGKREHSLPCEESKDTDNDSPEPSRTAVLRLCKHCGTREEEDKKFIICSHRTCHFKYYHIRCLNAAQLAHKHQPDGVWYCPSCLCRACLTDKDDHLVCLCDRCDEAYHTYCMNPPRKAIPEGIWCCTLCNKERIKEGMRRFEENVLAMQVARNEGIKQSKRHGSKKDVKIEHEEYCEGTEANCQGDMKFNEPQLVKDVDTEPLNKQLQQGSPSQHRTVQHRQLKKQFQQGSPSCQHTIVQHSLLKQNDVKQLQINGDIHQPEKNSVTVQLKNGTKMHQQRRSSLNGDRKKIHKQQRSHFNGQVTRIDKRRGYPDERNLKKRYGRNDVEGQHTNGDMVEQPAGKLQGRKAEQIRGRCRLQGGVRIRQQNGNKKQTNEVDAMGSFGVLFDAMDVSEKMDKEAHRKAANAKKNR